eukprot:6791116-Pyramimonas_sp.AAC.2
MESGRHLLVRLVSGALLGDSSAPGRRLSGLRSFKDIRDMVRTLLGGVFARIHIVGLVRSLCEVEA